MTDTKVNTFERRINGDKVVTFTNSRLVTSDQTFLDMASLSAWYHEDPKSNYVGMVELFANMANVPVPSLKTFVDTGAVIETNGYDAGFTYSIQVSKPFNCKTAVDTSDLYDEPGLNGSIFQIVLDREYRPGDVLTYDSVYGEQLIVSEDMQVVTEGEQRDRKSVV